MSETSFARDLECVFVFGTHGRSEVAFTSLSTMLKSIADSKCRVVVVDSGSFNPSRIERFQSKIIDYIWCPSDVTMAFARNIGYHFASEKYNFDWVGFVEDDVHYSISWYQELMRVAYHLKGKQSPHGLYYGCFSASPGGMKDDESVVYDATNDCYAEFFGSRASQRLYTNSFFANICGKWDSDLLGISTCQSGNLNHRMTMRGYCSANISHRLLCTFVEHSGSTWQGTRDLGPAAIDKRLEYHVSVVRRAKELHWTGDERANFEIDRSNKALITERYTGVESLARKQRYGLLRRIFFKLF